jgi:hypothetical protein
MLLGINGMVYPEGTHPEGLPYERDFYCKCFSET